MLKHKITLLTLITGLLVAPAAADLEFRDPDNVSFYTGLEFNGDNQIYGLAEPTASNSPVRLQDIETGYYNLTGDTLEGPLNANGNNINNFFNDACENGRVVKDIYNNGSFACGSLNANLGFSDVLDVNNTANQNINMNGFTLTSLGPPQGNLDAVRRQELTGFLNRSNGTLDGDLNFNGYNAELRGGYISNDGDDEGIRVLDNGGVRIEEGVLNVSGNSLTGLPTSDNSNDAVRQDQLSNYLKRNTDTLSGNLSFDNTYYVKDLPEPENSQDAATKNYVDTNTIPDDQNLEQVLVNGNSTGSYDINLNSNDINNVDCLGDGC